MFCGAGGSTTGAKQSGLRVVLAVNHWYTAIQTHQANHPDVRHICARIDDIDPRHDKTLPNFDVLLASPECTHHSNARGAAPIDDQKRATPWHVCLWAEVKRPKWIVVENVREFRDWGPVKNGKPIKARKGETFVAWIDCLKSLGYNVEHRLLNAADFGEATKRIRLFVVARLGRGAIPWPQPSHAKEKWRGAVEIIDWDLPCPSIFGRKRPLEDKTLRRIEIGCRKFVGRKDPFIVKLRGTSTAVPTSDPCPTVTGGGNHLYVTAPFQLKAMGRNAGQAKDIQQPLPTIVAARENHAVVAPFLVPHFNERDGQAPRTHDVAEPAPSVTSRGAGNLAVPFVLQRQGYFDCHKDKPPQSVEAPVPTITGSHSPGHVVMPFLTRVAGPGSQRVDESADGVDEPLSTCTAKERHGLALAVPDMDAHYDALLRSLQKVPNDVGRQLIATMRELGIGDIGFRMLQNHELAAAQGFPKGYTLTGTKSEQTRQIGNAVPPGFIRAICDAIQEAA